MIYAVTIYTGIFEFEDRLKLMAQFLLLCQIDRLKIKKNEVLTFPNFYFCDLFCPCPITHWCLEVDR